MEKGKEDCSNYFHTELLWTDGNTATMVKSSQPSTIRPMVLVRNLQR